MARATQDEQRILHYRRAIIGGLRSLMQLQLVDEADMYYISDPRLAQGGLRTTTYNNEIRCDNVQHGLMASFDILEHFRADDYLIP